MATPTGTRRSDEAGASPAADRRRLRELSVDACLELLAAHHVGRVAVDDGDGPVVLPVNYVLDQGSVLFRTDEGSKLDAAMRGARVAFEIDGVDERRRIGWSVLVRGRVVEVTDGDELDRVRQLPLDPFVGGHKEHYVRVLSTNMSGRRIALPATIPDGWFEAPELGQTWRGRDGDDLLG